MKVIVLISVAVLHLVYGDYEFPTPQVRFFTNGGFEVSLPLDPNINLMAFHGKKNVELDDRESGTWNQDITRATGNRFVFLEANAKFNLGDRLHYWLHVIHSGLGYDLLYQTEEVKRFEPRPPGLEKTTYEFQQPRIRFLSPRGFQVSVPDEDGISLMAFHGQINMPFIGRTAGTFSKDIRRPIDGLFTFKDTGTKFNRCDKLYYWLYVVYKGQGYHLEDQHYEYRGDELQNHNIHFEDEEQTTNSQIDVRNTDQKTPQCPISISMVNGRREFCSGAMIFQEDFKSHTLNEQLWTIEKRIPLEPDYEFVLYSNQSISFAQRGGLKIEPALLTDIYGEEALRQDRAIDDCTAEDRSSMECRFDRRFTNTFAPPVISSQINTLGKFSFLFGRVEIRARLPIGDWLCPRLWLQPQGFKYDKTDYKAGLISLGKVVNVPSLSGEKFARQGAIFGSEEPLRSTFLSQKSVAESWMSQFHTFVVEWKPEGLSFFIDGERQSVNEDWRNTQIAIPGSQAWMINGHPAPFDQEFYLTIGLSVGGRNDFALFEAPWDRTSPQMRREFYQDKAAWFSTWAGDQKTLEVEYVRVFAL